MIVQYLLVEGNRWQTFDRYAAGKCIFVDCLWS